MPHKFISPPYFSFMGPGLIGILIGIPNLTCPTWGSCFSPSNFSFSLIKELTLLSMRLLKPPFWKSFSTFIFPNHNTDSALSLVNSPFEICF